MLMSGWRSLENGNKRYCFLGVWRYFELWQPTKLFLVLKQSKSKSCLLAHFELPTKLTEDFSIVLNGLKRYQTRLFIHLSMSILLFVQEKKSKRFILQFVNGVTFNYLLISRESAMSVSQRDLKKRCVTLSDICLKPKESKAQIGWYPLAKTFFYCKLP